jgi:hypothetical protein
MPTADQPRTGNSDGAAGTSAPRRTINRRRPTVARFRFQPDARRLRALLDEVTTALGTSDPLLRRKVRLLVGEIVARLLDRCPDGAVNLDLEIKADSVRVDIFENDGECDFWDGLDEVVFSDLTTAWGRDRRGTGGAWFEIAAPTASGPGVRPQ